MTRINVVHPAELCDQHLLAEWRELTRIPNGILNGHFKIDLNNIPEEYTIRTEDNPNGGRGHVKFFTNKLLYLKNRYFDILKECGLRNFDVKDYWPHGRFFDQRLMNDYIPTNKAKTLNRKRIKERLPKNARYFGKEIK